MRARLLDISRLISRVGKGPMTGVDRVELAYFEEFVRRRRKMLCLCRIPGRYVFLDVTGAKEILNRIKGVTPWGSRDFLSRLSRNKTPVFQQCLSDLRRYSLCRCLPNGLGRTLKKITPEGVDYFNVGHSNLRQKVLAAVKAQPSSKIIVLIHDIIPITYPQFSRTEVVQRFIQDMMRVSSMADVIIYNSASTKAKAEAYFAECGRVPQSLVAHLGIQGHISKATQPVVIEEEEPIFVILGTIEPRKNHLLLLNIWQTYQKTVPPADIPHLHIIGQRGWNNENVFNILDSDPMVGVSVFEYNNLNDADAQRRLANCTAMLFPSHAEGFGLPLLEAAQLGVPIICGENAIYRELLGDYPLYLNVDNSYAWSKGILERAGRKRESEAERQVRAKSVKIPDWQEHFDQIFRFV